MRLITSHELHDISDAELQTLFNEVSKALAQTMPKTPERRNALASLENIERMRSMRHQLQ